jgi:predicted phosphodiesterase
MLLAVIGGIHGNVAALEKALERVAAEGIHLVLCTGNVAAGGPHPNEVIDLLRERRVVCVQGESDRRVVRALRKAASLKARLPEDVYAALEKAHELLSSANVEFLRSLPRERVLSVETTSLHLCHGTVSSQSDALRETDSLDRFRRQREAANADIIVCGSDGPAFVRWVEQTLFVNPGELVGELGGARFITVNTDAEPFEAAFHEL